MLLSFFASFLLLFYYCFSWFLYSYLLLLLLRAKEWYLERAIQKNQRRRTIKGAKFILTFGFPNTFSPIVFIYPFIKLLKNAFTKMHFLPQNNVKQKRFVRWGELMISTKHPFSSITSLCSAVEREITTLSNCFTLIGSAQNWFQARILNSRCFCKDFFLCGCK